MLEQFGLVETSAKHIRVGDIFGRLTVVAVGQIPGTYRYFGICQCECGSALKAVRSDGLLSGAVIGCGCIQRERTTTHHLTGSRHYTRWRHMMDRCYNPKCKAFPDYGARGIAVDIAWHTIGGFVAGLPDGFFEGAEIDRINNDGDYEPGNVRWVTRKINTRNRRSASLLSFGGRTMSVTEWSEETGIHHATIWTRVFVQKWTVESALSTPAMSARERMAKAREAQWAGHIHKTRPKPRSVATYPFGGESKTLAEISLLTGIPSKLLRKRICERGWTVEKATEKPT
jgi:hypothetical protein